MKPTHLSNALSPMVVTVSGIVKLPVKSQLLNAFSPISVTFLPSIADGNNNSPAAVPVYPVMDTVPSALLAYVS